MRVSEALSIGVVCAYLAVSGPASAECREVGLTDPALAAFAEPAGKVFVSVDGSGVALQGHDPVGYFTDKKPVKGKPEISSSYRGAVYFFASEDHRKMFEDSPAKYEPQFGGYCGYAASINKVSPIDVNFWEILDGRLVLQHNQKAWDLWHKDVPGNLKKADMNWPGLVQSNGKPIARLVNVDKTGLALEGYDPVAYFADGKPVKGELKFTSLFRGARYRFASAEHKSMFDQNPRMYEPQFGGYCGYAASINKVSTIDPAIFQIVEGRLVLQHTKDAYDKFNKDVAKSYAKAGVNWPGLSASGCD